MNQNIFINNFIIVVHLPWHCLQGRDSLLFIFVKIMQACHH